MGVKPQFLVFCLILVLLLLHAPSELHLTSTSDDPGEPTEDHRFIKILVTKYPNLDQRYFENLECNNLPSTVTCKLIGNSEKGANENSNALVDESDVIEIYGNDIVNDKFYDISANSKHKFLMIVNYNNFESPHVAKEPKRWIAALYNNSSRWNDFQIVVSHQQGSIVPFQTYNHLLAIPGVKDYIVQNEMRSEKGRVQTALAVFISSHKGHGFDRLQLATQIAELIDVHVYGKILPSFRSKLPNTKSPGRADCPASRWFHPTGTLCLMKPYPFTLSFENSRAMDYATEKVYNPLLIGSVPVYIGAPNIEDLVPFKSVILVDDFPNVKELTDYMKCIWQNTKLYNYYLNWKERQDTHSWQRIVETPNPFCGACRLVFEKSASLQNDSRRFPRSLPIQRENVGSQAPFKECAPNNPKAVSFPGR